MKRLIPGFKLLLLVAVLFAFLANTNPFELAPQLYVIPYLLIFFIVFSFAGRLVSVRKIFTKRQRYIASTIVATYAVLAIALLSIGGLFYRDALIMTLLFAGCVVYILKMDLFR